MKENEINILKILNKTKIQNNLNLLKSKYSVYKMYDFLTLILLLSNASNTILDPMLINYITTATLASLKLITFNFSMKNNEIIKSILLKNRENILNIIQNELINSEIYKECISEYDNYLTNLAKLYEEMKLTDPMKSSIAFDILLHKGNFSHNHKYNYTIYKYNNDYEIDEILGSRVATGNTVCRHESSMLTDLEKKLGNNSYNLSVYTQQKDNNGNINTDDIHVNHRITIIEEEGNIYASDPTNRCFISNFKQYDNKYIYGEPISLCKNINNNSIFVIIDENQKNINSESANLSKENINQKYKEVLSTIYYNIDLISDFYDESIYQLEKISELNKTLIPLSNQKIKKWKIW